MEYLNAFLCGGLLCAVGQIILDKTSLTPARILTGYVVAGVLLQAVGVYQYIVDWGGAGATVPLTGFGYSLAKGVAKAVAEEGLLGVLTGGLTASPSPLQKAESPRRWCFPCWRRCWCGPKKNVDKYPVGVYNATVIKIPPGGIRLWKILVAAARERPSTARQRSRKNS